jgi:hypothetical protein
LIAFSFGLQLLLQLPIELGLLKAEGRPGTMDFLRFPHSLKDIVG